MDVIGQVAIEFIFSMFVLFVAYGTAFNPKQRETFGPILGRILVGSTVGLGIFCSGTIISTGYSGAIMNPGRFFRLQTRQSIDFQCIHV